MLTDRNGAITWRAVADPFGATYPSIETVTNNLRFPGQYYDAETGLHYNYYRTYDPSTGRYLQSDPIGLAGGINTYAYVGASPLSYIDPLGLEAMDWLWGMIYKATGGWSPEGSADVAAGFGDTLTFGLTDKLRDWMGINGGINKCSSAYRFGELGGVGLSLAFGGAHLGRNALYQTGKRGGLDLGMRRLFSDPRVWSTVRDMWSKAAGGGIRALAARGQSLHHWLIPQRWFKYNAGLNYLPLTASFNSWMNGSTRARRAVEWGLRLTILGIYGAPVTAGGRNAFRDCECSQ